MINANLSISRIMLYSLILLYFLLSMHLWIGWDGLLGRLNMMVGLLSLFVMIKGRIHFDFSKVNVLTFVFIVIADFFYGYDMDILIGFHFLPFFIIIFLNDEDKLQCLSFITKWYGYLMGIGLVVYAITYFVDIPHFGYVSFSNVSEETGYGHCKNYIFYIKSAIYENRFNGPFLEPGYVGMISAFLLFANQFDFKKKGMVFILLSLLFSLSLAGYVLLFIAFFMLMIYRGGNKYLFILTITFVALYVFAIGYNGGDNIINEKILSRLETDNERGFSGNNRVTDVLMMYYYALWNDPHALLWGYSKDMMDWLLENGANGTGYYMSMCMYGIVGTTLSLMPYMLYFLYCKQKKWAFLFLIFVLMMFWQRNYPLWSSWIICYVYGITYEKNRLALMKS